MSAADTPRVVSADEAREIIANGRAQVDAGWGGIGVLADAAHTITVQAAQIEAVIALHADQDGHCGWCCEDADGSEPLWATYPCATARAVGVTA